MSCIKAPTVSAPDLSLLLPSLNIAVPPPHIGLSLCCELSVTVPIEIPPITLIPGIALLLTPINAAVQSAIDELNDLLDSLQVDCPLE